MSGGDGYLTNALYREVAALLTQAGIEHRVDQGAKHFHVKFVHCGVERTQILHLGPNNKGSTRRKTIIRFRKIVEAERAFRDQQTSPELELEQPAMSEQEKPAADPPSPSFDLALHVVDDEPRVLDTDLGKRLGHARAYAIRQVINRNADELRRYGPLPTRRGQSRGQKFDAYYLNEPQAVLVCLRSDAPSAPDAREVVINTFMAVRRGQLVPAIASINTDAMKANAQFAASAAGGAAKNAVANVRAEVARLNERFDMQARFTQEMRRDLKQALVEISGRFTGPASAVALHAAEYVEIGGVYDLACLLGPVRNRALLTNNIKASLNSYCRRQWLFTPEAPVRGQMVIHWPKTAVADWLVADGHALIERHLRAHAPKAELLPFKKPGEVAK